MSGSGPSLYSPTLFQEGQGAYFKSGKLGGEGGGGWTASEHGRK